MQRDAARHIPAVHSLACWYEKLFNEYSWADVSVINCSTVKLLRKKEGAMMER